MLSAQLKKQPRALSANATQEIPPALEELILCCLKKQPAERPSARGLGERLAGLDLEVWDQKRASEWWQLKGQSGPGTTTEVDTTLPVLPSGTERIP